MSPYALLADDTPPVNPITEAARLRAQRALAGRRGIAATRTPAQLAAIARLAEADGSENIGTVPDHWDEAKAA